jgi:hypothetical protein
MFNVVGVLLKKQWGRLSTYSGSRRLSMFSLILLFGLDIYVLGLLFSGMQEAASTIEYPELAISRGCETMTEDFLKLDVAGKADSLERYVALRGDAENIVMAASDEVMSASGFAETEKLPVCAQVRDKLRSYANATALATLYQDFDNRRRKQLSINSEIIELKSSYDSALLEKVAGQRREDSILPAEATKIKSIIASKTTESELLEKKLADIRRTIENHPLIQDYVAFVNAQPYAAEFAKARAEYNHLSFWYPIKTFLAELFFLLPLLLLAIVWSLRAMKVQSHTQTLISSHLILVCAIPIFARMVDFVYDLLPHRLLENLIASLEELNLGFLWNYVAILGGIGAAVLVIVIAQRTFFSPTRQRSARLRKTLCLECGEKLHSADQAWCEFCGTNQMGRCEHCAKPHRLLAFHCEHCGSVTAGNAEI